MAVPTVRDHTTSQGFAAARVTVGRPAATVDGDLLIAICGFRTTSAVAPAPPAGWALVGQPQRRFTNSWLAIYTKIAAPDDAPWTFNYTQGGSLGAMGTILAVAGASAVDVIATANNADGTNQAAHPTPPVTPPLGQELVLHVAHSAVASSTPGTYAWPAGPTVIPDRTISATGYAMTHGIAYESGPMPAATVPGVTATFTPAGSYAVASFAVRPAPVQAAPVAFSASSNMTGVGGIRHRGGGAFAASSDFAGAGELVASSSAWPPARLVARQAAARIAASSSAHRTPTDPPARID